MENIYLFKKKNKKKGKTQRNHSKETSEFEIYEI